MDIKPKHFIVVPRDAYNVLADRYVTLDEAGESAKERCADEGTQVYVLKLVAVAAKDSPPVTLRKLK